MVSHLFSGMQSSLEPQITVFNRSTTARSHIKLEQNRRTAQCHSEMRMHCLRRLCSISLLNSASMHSCLLHNDAMHRLHKQLSQALLFCTPGTGTIQLTARSIERTSCCCCCCWRCRAAHSHTILIYKHYACTLTHGLPSRRISIRSLGNSALHQ
jgi:hypothetical protein